MEKDCQRKVVKNSLVGPNIDESRNDAYFLECLVNGKPTRAYVDTGCGGVLIKKEVAEALGLDVVPSSTTISG